MLLAAARTLSESPMKTTARKVIGIILAVALAAIFLAQWLRDGQQRRMEARLAGQVFAAKDYYPLAAGMQWTYVIRDGEDGGELTVTVAGPTVFNGRPAYKLIFSDNAYKILGFGEAGVVKYKESEGDEEEVYDPVGLILPDLEFGRARTFHPAYTMTTRWLEKPLRASAEMSFWVEAVETVRVPAGTFTDTLRVGYYDRWDEEDGSFDISRGRIWFAKGVGIVKITGKHTVVDEQSGERETTKETHELRAFHRPKGEQVR